MNDISLMYLLQLAWRRIWALVIALVFFATCAFCFCKFLATPSYMATASVLVTNGGTITNEIATASESVNGTDITASLSLANTIVDILKTSDIYKQLAGKINVDYTYQELINKVSVTRRNENTLFVDIKFKASTENEAILLANTFASLAPEYITKYIPYSNAMTASTADKADKVYPRTAVTTAVAGLVGAALAFVVVLIIDSFDQAIKGEEDFTSNYDIPLLGSVPDFENTAVMGYSTKGGYHNGY